MANVTIKVRDGGVLNMDDPANEVGPENYTKKADFRRDGESEVTREGWDHYRPNASGDATNQRTAFSGANASVDTVAEVRRANGEAVHVAVCKALGIIKWFDYTSSEWVVIGSGFTTSGVAGWQIESVGGVAVFNNRVDLPVSWVIGEAAVIPLYELREQGIASVGDIAESNGMLLLSDLTQIKDSELSGVMNSGSPYGVVASNKVERVSYRMTWSNFGNPRDMAATVAGSISSGSPTLTTAWPMASFSVGDELTILGAGTAGGNLVAKITARSGATVTLDTNAATSVTNADVQKTTALNSVVGYKDLDDDGTPILRQKRLNNRVVAYKASGRIMVGYYTGDLDEPWVYDTAYAPDAGAASRGLVWTGTLVDVAGRYHLYAGSSYFYTFSLGSQEPKIHGLLSKCARTMFFSNVQGQTPTHPPYAAVNGVTEEVFITASVGTTPTTYNTMAYRYTEGEESVSEVSDFRFICAATLHRPNGNKTVDNSVLWFVLGGRDGLVTVDGISPTRHGVAFQPRIVFGLNALGDERNEKHLSEWIPLFTTNSPSFTLSLTAAPSPASVPSSVGTATISGAPSVATIHAQAIYFREEIYTSGTLRFSGRVLVFEQAGGRSVTRTKS